MYMKTALREIRLRAPGYPWGDGHPVVLVSL